ncbi:MAG TPA: hypothetical protein PLU30_25120 [Verrucomicrobiae bacterium]|nr:hypothetical protein [Verrucomicrobiae bacterium]
MADLSREELKMVIDHVKAEAERKRAEEKDARETNSFLLWLIGICLALAMVVIFLTAIGVCPE